MAGFAMDYENSPYTITAHHGTTWYNVVVHDTGGLAPTVFVYDQTILTEKQMAQEVTVNAAALSGSLTASGHAVVPGIYFDTGKPR